MGRVMARIMLQSWTAYMRRHASAEDPQVYERYMFSPPLARDSLPENLAKGLRALDLVMRPDGEGGAMDLVPAIRSNVKASSLLFPADGTVRLMLRDVTQMFHVLWSAQMSRLPNNSGSDIAASSRQHSNSNSDACLELAHHISSRVDYIVCHEVATKNSPVPC
jgi:hypothetical protein